MKFLLDIKTASSWRYYKIFKSVLTFWGSLEHDLKEDWNFCLVWKLHQTSPFMWHSATSLKTTMKFLLGTKTAWSGDYYQTFKSIFVFWHLFEQDLKKGWNFCLVSKLYQARNTTSFPSPFLLSRNSGTWLKKGLNFMLDVKTTSSGVYYKDFKSIFAVWDILENDLQNAWNFFFLWKILSNFLSPFLFSETLWNMT